MNESRESKNAEQLEELLLLTEEIQEELLMILTSVAIVIYFGESIKKVLSVNLLLLFVLSQGAYVGIRCYLKVWLEKRPY